MATEFSTQQLAKVGEAAVSLKFEREPFSWGTIGNFRDDRGIDFLVNVHDTNLEPQEFRIGVQVKTGKSYFERPKHLADDTVAGWWYGERNRKHFDYWLGCDVPVLLVLHDEHGGDKPSYWVHVESSAVISTGKGAKILVPRSQTISERCKDHLLRVAVRQSASLPLEGTILSDGLSTAPLERQLRYALVVPRLVSPHLQTSLENPISAYEAIALLARGRFRQLYSITEQHDGVPQVDAVPADADWGWQAAGAIWNWLETNTTDHLESVLASAPNQHNETAIGVLLACALWRLECHQDAIALLDGLMQRDHPDSLDRAWTLVQRARFHADRGDSSLALADIKAARQLLPLVRDDEVVSAPMVSALAAGAARTSNVIAWAKGFRTGTEDAESIEDLVAKQQEAYLELLKVSDTAVSWWRSQDTALALGREQDRRFESWAADDPALYTGGSPVPETGLLSAEFNADIAGEHGHWKALSARRGMQCLMQAPSCLDAAAEIEVGIDTLRRCGDSNRLTKAMRHLLKIGPLEPVAASMAKVATSGWTHTTAKTNFEALALAGDLIEQSAADQFLEQCARAACGEPTELGCTQDEGFFSLPAYATDAAAGVLPAASRSSHDGLARHLAKLPEVPAVSFLRGLERALFFLDYGQVSPANRRYLHALAERGDARLSAAIWSWFANHGDATALRSLAQAAAQGEIHALAEITDVSVFEESESAALVGVLAERVDRARIDALAGGGSSGNTAVCHALTRLNLRIPASAHWEPIITFLSEPRTFLEEKHAICFALAADPKRIPLDVRNQLGAVVGIAASGSAAFWRGTEAAGMELRLQIALDLIDTDGINDAVARLALGSHQEREDACLVLRSSACANRRLLLKFLARDTNFTVRLRAVQTIGSLVAQEASDADIDLAWEIACDDGRQLPIALLEGFRMTSGVPGSIAREISNSLVQHPSAAMQYHVARVQQLRQLDA